MPDLDDRRARLHDARLYLVCDLRPGGRALAEVLAPALAGGVDIVQLRDKRASDDELLAAAAIARRLCDEAGALLILNDRPDL
ncbi:MAG: thiamine phosphate synthase, partial [Solirubrobacteraceae bacterium]